MMAWLWHWFASLMLNLVQGVLGSVLLPVRARCLPSARSALVALMLLSPFVPVMRDRGAADLPAELDLWALPGLLIVPMLIVALAGICAGWFGESRRLFAIAIPGLAIWLVIDSITAILIGYPPGWPALAASDDAVPQIGLLWFALALSVLLVRENTARWRTWPVSLLAVWFIVWLPAAGSDLNRPVWVEPAGLAAAREERLGRLAGESVIYAQEGLIDAALTALQAQRPGVIDLYFIGLAPYAGQDVFARELQFAKDLFDERFDARDRSLLLINNPDTVQTAPLATITSLQRSLDHLGRLMDIDEDFALLYLSSHGQRGGWISFASWPLQLYDLEPARLRQMLDAAGIRRRVIVVSACYSGAFIDAFDDDHSLVITAAAADRTSFGCSNEADLTYFGRAFLAQALSQTRSFEQAYELARQAVLAQETREGLLPSMPQIRVGRAVPDWLGRYESSLAAGQPVRADSQAIGTPAQISPVGAASPARR